MWHFYEFGSLFSRPFYYCQCCENNIHFSVYDPERKMCHNCIMTEEVDQNQMNQFKRWYGDNLL